MWLVCFLLPKIQQCPNPETSLPMILYAVLPPQTLQAPLCIRLLFAKTLAGVSQVTTFFGVRCFKFMMPVSSFLPVKYDSECAIELPGTFS